MSVVYQIKDWDQHFENDRSRQRDKCSFVCVPNKQHGMGFCRLMAMPDGLSIYGAWHLITGACSQQPKPRNGWLTDDGRGPHGDRTVTAWGANDLALKFRRNTEEMQRALEVLSSASIGWIVAHGKSESNRQVTADSPPTHLERKKEGRKEDAPQEITNHPTVDACIATLDKLGSGYAHDEIRRAFDSFGITAQDGWWRWGKHMVTDWRLAIARRIDEERLRSKAVRNKGRDFCE